MNPVDRTLLVLIILGLTLQVAILLAFFIAWPIIRDYLEAIHQAQITVVKNVSGRVGTARMTSGLPPHVEEERRIGVARRGQRHVVGGEPDSEQAKALRRGLQQPDEAGVEA